MASQAKTIEAKKDEFRAYLEKTGVVDQLTKVQFPYMKKMINQVILQNL